MYVILYSVTEKVCRAVGFSSEGGDAIEVYEALALMISFGTLVALLLTSDKRK
ncbi:putative holin-like toxin [Desulfitobacterium hafniense]|uniref:putative holin-like toxin n=1 Tax=Desulfitobacterium hafniense TaxID=49338 RepID=UPI003D0836D0